MRHYDDSSLGYQKLNRATNKYLSCDSNGKKKDAIYMCICALRLDYYINLVCPVRQVTLKKKYYLIEYHPFTSHSSRFYSLFMDTNVYFIVKSDFSY